MSAASQPTSKVAQFSGAHAAVATLLRCGIAAGFGIPSIHNIALYDVLRQTPEFHHWVVRHEQAAGFAADGFYRHSGQPAVVFASTGPGNLFTLVPLLESLQTNTPVLLIGTNIASSLLEKTGGALHETPQQLDIIRPLTRFAHRVASPDAIPGALADAIEVLRGPAPGPAFVEIPHDFLLAPASATLPPASGPSKAAEISSQKDIALAAEQVRLSRRPVVLVGSGVHKSAGAVQKTAEALQAPVFTTTSGKGMIADDHPLAMGCISRLGAVQEVFLESDLLVSFGARLTEFDTGRFGLKLPPQHIQVVEDRNYAGERFPSIRLIGDISSIAQALTDQAATRSGWCDVAGIRLREAARLQGLEQESYATLMLLRGVLGRQDLLVNDQSILNYWASAFFPVMEPGTFLYPSGSGTLGYGLPAAIGAACSMQRSGQQRKIVCVAGDGGFQYTQHELATLAQYNLPVKILLVNDQAYGIIGFLQRSMFGEMHEVALKNPDFCRVAEAYGIRSEHVASLEQLRKRLPDWLDAPGPALLEWRVELKSPWEAGAIPRPASIQRKDS